MPRVKINSLKYKSADLPKFIRVKLAETGKNQEDLANAIGIAPSSFSNRMKKSLFSYTDLVLILDEVKASDEEIVKLFKKDYFKK